MSSPSPFEIGRQVGTNFYNTRREARDQSAIEGILSQAIGSGDPAVLQSSIGKILSQVSPERQGAAIKYLENAYTNIQERHKEEQQFKREKEAGLVPGVNATSQAAIFKENAKAGRLAQYGIGGEQQQQQQQQQMPIQGQQEASMQAPKIATNQTTRSSSDESPFTRMSDNQLVVASGAPDKEISEPAKTELKRRQEDRKIGQKREEAVFKSDLSRSEKVIERADQIAEQLPQKRTALSLMKDAVSNKNLSFFSPDNIAEITGIEGFRSPEGSIFKTAGKEYFLGNIARAGARPNQWIEQQISDMMAKIGRSTEANLSVLRALENELDLDETRVKITNEISDELKNKGDLGQGKLGSMVNKQLSQYAEKRQDVLFNDLRAIKAISENAPQKFRKVEKGTQVSEFVAQALLKQFNNDPKKAAVEAKKLGYTF